MIRTLWNYMTWFEPHMTWLFGVLLIIDTTFWNHFVDNFLTYPEGFILLTGMLLFLAGRDAIGYRKRLQRVEKEKEHMDEQVMAWKTYATQDHDS